SPLRIGPIFNPRARMKAPSGLRRCSCCCLFYAAGIGHRPGMVLEAGAQIGNLSLVAHELRVALLEAIVGERRQPGWRRYVAAGRVDSGAALPVLGEIPGDEKLGGIG